MPFHPLQNKEGFCFGVDSVLLSDYAKNKIIDNHKIEGIGDDFIPSLVDKSIIDDVILVDDSNREKFIKFNKNHPKGHFLQSPEWAKLKSEWINEVVLSEDKDKNKHLVCSIFGGVATRCLFFYLSSTRNT